MKTQNFSHQPLARLIILTLGLLLATAAASTPALAQAPPPLMFIENVGQFPPPADGAALRFQVHSSQGMLSLADDALWFTLLATPASQLQRQDSPLLPPGPPETPKVQSLIPNLPPGVNLKLTFVDANPLAHLEPFDRLDMHLSYLTGSDPARWHAGVPVWGGVRYVDLYPGVDLEITGENGRLAQRFVFKEDVAAQAEGSALNGIRFRVEGAEALNLAGPDQLQAATPLGDFTIPLPQAVDSSGAALNLSTGPQINGLEIASPLVSAPPPADSPVQSAAGGDLLYSTYLGGPGALDSGRDVAADPAGHAYVTGLAYPGFPSTPGVFDPGIEGVYTDVFVAKIKPDGAGLVYATFLGGSDFEAGSAITVDAAGQATVTGYTTSPDFPTTPGAYDSTRAGESDAFVAKLNADGTGLIYATLFGGSSDIDFGLALATDAAGSAYIAGFTESTDFPTTAQVGATAYLGGLTDAFAVKVAPDGSNLVYSTLLGGSDSEYGYAVAIDGAGNAYLTGYTFSPNFPTTPGAYDRTLSSTEAFVVKLNPAGAVAYSTFIGGSGGDYGYALAVDSGGSAYLSGFTDSTDFPVTPGAFDTTFNAGYSGDAFVAKLSPAGSGLVYATYLGGQHHDYGEDLAVDEAGHAYLIGQTSSADFPTTPGAWDRVCAGCAQTYPYSDAFVARLHPNGGLAYSTFLGGDNYERGYGLALAGADELFLSGDTNSPDFPTSPTAFDTTLDGYGDAYVSKLRLNSQAPPPPPPVPAHTCAPTPLGEVTVGQEPHGLAVDSARQRVYVANYGSDTVSVIDSSTNTVVQTIGGLPAAHAIAHDPQRNVIWVTNQSADQVTPIQANAEATAFTVLPAVAVEDMPWGVAYDPVHQYVYVANSQSDSVTVINAETRAVVTTIRGSFLRPFHLAANPLTGKVYVVNFGGPNQSVTVLNGTMVSKVVSLYDSKEPYGLAVDETRNLVYVATVEPHRLVVIGPRQGVPDQFLGWAAFHRGFGNPRRPLPLRMIAVNPALGPAGDGGHLWATTTLADGSEANQALFIPKGWGGSFHFPLAQNVGYYPADGIAIDRATNRVYISSGFVPGTVTVIGDHATLCRDALTKIATLEAGTGQVPGEDSEPIGVEIWQNQEDSSSPGSDLNRDGRVDLLDLTWVAARYGTADLTADLNGDGRVDILDLVRVANDYEE